MLPLVALLAPSPGCLYDSFILLVWNNVYAPKQLRVQPPQFLCVSDDCLLQKERSTPPWGSAMGWGQRSLLPPSQWWQLRLQTLLGAYQRPAPLEHLAVVLNHLGAAGTKVREHTPKFRRITNLNDSVAPNNKWFLKKLSLLVNYIWKT